MGTGIVLSMEWVTAKYRALSTNIVLFVLTVVDYGGVSLAAWYFANNFTAYKLVMALPAFSAIFLYCIMGESPRWLLTQKKYSQAIKSISIAGRINGKPLQSHTIRQIENSTALTKKEKSIDDQTSTVTITMMLREKVLAFRLAIVSLVWLFIFFAYFGMLFGSTNMHSNKYISFLIIGWADLPGNLISGLIINRLGRKITVGVPLLIYGILLLASTQVPKEGIFVLFIVSKTSITTAFTAMSTYGSEFWPTSIRSTASGLGSMAGRLGSILASMSVVLVEYHVHLPTFLYASGAMLGSILLFAFLPETQKCDKLPDTIEQALAIGKCVEKRRQSMKDERFIKDDISR